MKKLILMLIATSFFSIAVAQEHVTFLGLSFNNPLDAFVDSLVSKGYTVKFNNHTTEASLYGDFAGVTGVEVKINSTVKSHLITSVKVNKKDQREELKYKYKSLVERFEKKYGELPPDKKSLVYLDMHGYGGDHGMAIFELKNNNGSKYGLIWINYSQEDYSDELFILYEDSVNSKLSKSESSTAVDNDI